MCGIAGIFMKNGRPVGDPGTIVKMTDTMVHRGPDASGYHIDGSIALGHRRLSIIDLGTGQQPMFNEDRSMAIVFNGEIYNFEELRSTLELKGHRFRTNSDTETILHAYEEWGEESPNQLRGMFAYAIWDGPQKKVFIARDRIGKKPLYYLDTPTFFIFASELKALLQYPGIRKEINLEALSDYLSFLYVPSPKCIFKEFRKLSPAHTLTVSDNQTKTVRYWDLSFRDDSVKTVSQWSGELNDAIQDAVRCRLKSEVPLGAFLSGGLDSSLVVAIMAKLMDRPVDTMSIGFSEEEFNEIPFAREVSSLYGTNHHEFIVDSLDDGLLGNMARIFDEPFADSSALPTYQVSRIARQVVTVALSGDGGDENFAGYRRYYFDQLENRVRRWIPPVIRRPLFGTMAQFYPKGDWLPQPLRAKTMLKNLSLSPEQGYFRTRSVFQPEMKRKLLRQDVQEKLGGYDSYSVLEPQFNSTRDLAPLSRIQYVDIMTYLPDDILVKVDRASMANSLEVRSPLLDHKVMELAAMIPSDMKIRKSSGKFILKETAKISLPKPIIHRKKMGFSVPLDKWFRETSVITILDHLYDRSSLIRDLGDHSYLEHLINSHRSGIGNYGTELWVLGILDGWYKEYMR
jgi:asparagine synthase (glutamine-hydrolysing)